LNEEKVLALLQESLMNVRAATPGDAAAIATIHVESWRTAYRGIIPQALLDSLQHEPRRAYWQSKLETDNAEVWVAERNGAALGWIACGEDRDVPEDASRREIHAIYVAPQHYRTGVGTALLNHYFSTLSHPPVAQVFLWVLQNNVAALAFYQQHGFDVTDTKKMISRAGADLVEIKLSKPLA
jgi:ribosomal protein S18 acetylase RimI-like enzyme